MAVAVLPRHPGLFATTRLRLIATDATWPTIRDWAILVLCGVLAACASTFLDLGLRRIPGHAIIRVVFPLAMGLALVPRRGAGSVMGGSAAITGAILQAYGARGDGIGFGGLTSLIATGPLLDWTLRRSHGGWKQIVMFALAGLASNLLAFGVRGTAKWLGWEAIGRRPFGEWLSQAGLTYPLCGLIAGLICGAVLFSVRPRPEPIAPTDGTP